MSEKVGLMTFVGSIPLPHVSSQCEIHNREGNKSTKVIKPTFSGDEDRGAFRRIYPFLIGIRASAVSGALS
jgi:hypothetical protein